MLKQLFLFFCLACFCATSFSQKKTGNVILYKKRDGMITRLDGKLMTSFGKPIPMDSGAYLVQAWWPKYQLFEKAIHVKPGRYVPVRLDLQLLPEVKKYRTQMFTWCLVKTVLYAVPSAISINYLMRSHKKRVSMDDTLDFFKSSAEDNLLSFNLAQTPREVEQSSRNYNRFKKSYDQLLIERNQYNKRRWLWIGSSIVISAALAYVGTKYKKPKKPKIERLLTYGGLYLQPGLYRPQDVQLVLNLNFK